MPTSLEIAGVETPEQVQFNSLMLQPGDRKCSSYPAVYGAYLALAKIGDPQGQEAHPLSKCTHRKII